ncbi:MAG: hypothetical protein KZQ58_11960 [gamma proteobacterium symbiont of Bathyaustriella thionipta]|nr:hypothetical protein [gamma proteobacterium symbiont of Bathyaustriella thionipta]
MNSRISQSLLLLLWLNMPAAMAWESTSGSNFRPYDSGDYQAGSSRYRDNFDTNNTQYDTTIKWPGNSGDATDTAYGQAYRKNYSTYTSKPYDQQFRPDMDNKLPESQVFEGQVWNNSEPLPAFRPLREDSRSKSNKANNSEVNHYRNVHSLPQQRDGTYRSQVEPYSSDSYYPYAQGSYPYTTGSYPNTLPTYGAGSYPYATGSYTNALPAYGAGSYPYATGSYPNTLPPYGVGSYPYSIPYSGYQDDYPYRNNVDTFHMDSLPFVGSPDSFNWSSPY